MLHLKQDLKDLRILVVEDNFLLAMTIAETLKEYGCEVVGPAPDVRFALKLVDDGDPDGALLDINLVGELSFPIAAALARRHLPFLFLTGYDDKRIIPPEYQSARLLSKPIDPARLSLAIAECVRVPKPH